MDDISPPSIEQDGPQDASCLATKDYLWMTAVSYQAEVNCTPAKFEEISNLLLSRPQLNSTHLFRADVIHDTSGVLQTPAEKEASASATGYGQDNRGNFKTAEEPVTWPSPVPAATIASLGLKLTRVVVRRLIPRKPKLDRAIEQTCFMYEEDGKSEITQKQRLIVYRPHVQKPSEIPWYHPSVEGLAFHYSENGPRSFLSVHFLPFSSQDVVPTTDRLHRTMLSLLKTLLRLTKHNERSSRQHLPEKILEIGTKIASALSVSVNTNIISLAPSSLKDTIVPQHLVQNTYTRLKETYASDLISRWVESTEPSKHVFEDLSIAAFLIEIWKQMYPPTSPFPGFVDLACGNGVLVYILLKEGYSGFGLDARRRKTWQILDIDSSLTEQLCIPYPFMNALGPTAALGFPGTSIHDGRFRPSTFIISNHADELTPWTPLLAYLSSPSSPNPFLAIPCCSHALSGARHRYSPKDVLQTDTVNPDNEQSKFGDLNALRTAKRVAQSDDKSMYGCLTRKVVTLAQEVGHVVELTLMRIPSTRNIGVVGNRKYAGGTMEGSLTVEEVVERECKISGGIEAAARIWVERVNKLQVGSGRGKVNLRQHEHCVE